MPADLRFGSLRALHPGWSAVTVVLVILGVAGTLGELWQFVSNGEWWNVPGVVAGVLLTYWLAVPAWRLARAGRRSSRPAPRADQAGSL